MVIAGLIGILALVLVMPFAIKQVEENLEVFLFCMGVAAAFVSAKMNLELVEEALREPVMIAAAVLVAGALFHIYKHQFSNVMKKLFEKVPLAIVVFFIVLLLGLLSSVITAIIASIILVEVIYLMPAGRQEKIIICIIACFSIGLGAALTPIGEPLATIAISRLDQDFMFLMRLLGKYIIPWVVLFSLMAAVYAARISRQNKAEGDYTGELAITADELEVEEDIIEEDTWKGIIIRALKVYLFVMALVFLGTGFEPLIDQYILGLSPQILYWVNMISAILDNATLCAAEVSPAMMSNPMIVEAILMGLLISGGMLIPGNIPNIICASKLRIGSKEWARLGVPLGLIVMGIVYAIIFVLKV